MMVSYEIYKLIHLICLLLLALTMGLLFYPEHLLRSKKGKIFTGFVSFFILVSGMGLLARIGFKHGQAFPFWISLKIANWFFLNVALFFAFKSKIIRHKIYIILVMLVLAIFNIWLAINKPL